MNNAKAVRKYAIILSSLISVIALGVAFYTGAGNVPQAVAGSYYATVTLPPQAVEVVKERVETIKEVAKAVLVIVETGEEGKTTDQVIKEAPITDLLEGAPVTPETSGLDKNNDGVVDVVDLVEIYVEKGLLKEPPKVNKEFAETLLDLLKRIYGPNLERFPSAEGKLWLLAMYKMAE